MALPVVPRLCRIGIDDWAMHKGRRYGTIIVNLETSRPVELLPGRDARVVASWLKAQPAWGCAK